MRNRPSAGRVSGRAVGHAASGPAHGGSGPQPGATIDPAAAHDLLAAFGPQEVTSGVSPGVAGLQRWAGNRAVTALILQRITDEQLGAPKTATTEYDKLPDDYEKMSDTQKIEAIKGMFGSKSSSVIERAWGLLGDELGQARANPDLFVRSVKADDDILDHGAFEALRDTFKRDVEQTASNYLAGNRQLVVGEMEKTGVAAETRGEEPTAEQDFGVQDVQKMAPEIDRLNEAKGKLLHTQIGEKVGTVDPDTHDATYEPAYFEPSGTPGSYAGRVEGKPSWEEVNEQWKRLLMVEAAIIRTSPASAYFLGEGGKADLAKLKETSDVKEARAILTTALMDLGAKIDKAIPLVGDDLTYIDFPPIQQQLLAGQTSPSGTEWSKPVEKAVAGEEISDATIAKLLSTLAVATVGAALFILASFATAGGAAGLGAVLFAGGAIAGGIQAGRSWDEYSDLATAHKATVDPEMALVTGEQVDEAFIAAILDTVFAVVDVWQAAKGAYVGLKGGKIALEAGKIGAEKSMQNLLRTVGKGGPEAADIVRRAVVEVGHEEASRMAGLSYDELADIVGKNSDLGKRLLSLGKTGIPEATAALLEKLPKVAELGSPEGADVLQAAIDHYGYIGTLKRVKGGWAGIRKSSAMASGAGEAMEAWRAGLVKELEEFIATESKNMSSAVRTGTEAAASDVDVQILGGAASELQTKAEGWLAGRLGTDIKGAKNLLDAEIFIDPLRAHLIDIMKDIDPAIRADIASRMESKARAMLYGAKLDEAKKLGKAAEDAVRKEAADLKVTIFEGFTPLSPAEQKRHAALVDGMMKKLGETTDAGEKAKLVEDISEAQARINASHPDAYVGGGVAVWVTSREGDVAKIAEALGISVEELTSVTVAKRVTAALSESKWLEAAVKRLSVPGAESLEDIDKLTKAVTNIGKHGFRGAEQLKAAKSINVDDLTQLMTDLKVWKDASTDVIQARFKGGELADIRSQLVTLLDALKGGTKTAVDSLGTEAMGAGIDLTKMAEFAKLMDWQATYARLVDTAKGATGAYIDMLQIALEARLAGPGEGEPAPKTEPNYQPGEGEPVFVP